MDAQIATFRTERDSMRLDLSLLGARDPVRNPQRSARVSAGAPRERSR
jgi:hypothetical protein